MTRSLHGFVERTGGSVSQPCGDLTLEEAMDRYGALVRLMPPDTRWELTEEAKPAPKEATK